MIKNMWYAILDSKEVPKAKPIGLTRFSQKIVLWRDQKGTVNCIFDKCCHRGASLSHGKVVKDHVECPFHGFQYDPTGKVIVIPANGSKTPVPDRYRVNAYEVREAYGLIWLWYGDQKSNLPEIPFFEDLKHGFTYGGFSEEWAVHYTRAIENQLDVVHLPFVHHNTIGSGHTTLVNGPVVKWEDQLMTFYVKNERDHGQKPQKPDEIEDFEKLFHLNFQMPNTWQNFISDKVRIFAAFVPIDETHTRIYIRFYQKFATIPVFREIVNFMSNFSNKVILHQDRRVVLTQLPLRSDLKMKEMLVQGDLPIIEYRKRRAELLEENVSKL